MTKIRDSETILKQVQDMVQDDKEKKKYEVLKRVLTFGEERSAG